MSSTSSKKEQVLRKMGYEVPNLKPISRWIHVCHHYMQLYSMCRDFRCLPGTGGLDDQDWLTVHFFTVIGGEMNQALSDLNK